MRVIIVMGFVIGAFVAGVFATQASTVAASPQAKNQWQYQCFEASGVVQVTERSNKMGQMGWELVTSAGSASSTLWCFKRPLWKK